MSTLNIQFSGNIVVAGGPTILFNYNVPDVEAYDTIDIVLKAGDKDVEVKLQPGAEMRLISITANWHGNELSYKPVKSANDRVFVLDAPHVFLGGAVAALGDKMQEKLYFSNGTKGAEAKDAQVRILIGRKAKA